MEHPARQIFAALPPITVMNLGCGDWQMIYIGNNLFHFHDSLPVGEFVARLGIPHHENFPSQELVEQTLSENHTRWGDPPEKLDDFIAMVCDYDNRQKIQRINALRAQADQLESELMNTKAKRTPDQQMGSARPSVHPRHTHSIGHRR